MRKRHISEFQKTRLANSGRASGMGIVEDNYGDESGIGNPYQHQSPFEHKPKGEDGEVIIIKKERAT